MNTQRNKILITGAAGFIGAALSQKLIKKGFNIIGIDNLNTYYDVALKNNRLNEIDKVNKENNSNKWSFYNNDIEDFDEISNIFNTEKPNIVINLAAQAGVRYSLLNPKSFTYTNIVGFGNILENCREHKIDHLIYASSSSVYGGNKSLPYKETQSVNHPVSLYAATKKANELMAHTYSHNYNLPATGLRFFTVYGPWGRPDMAPIIFAKAISKGEVINVNNFGNMQRDFTYIDDIIEGVYRCILKPATAENNFDYLEPNPSTSYAPHRIFNIGSSNSINLLNFIEILERNLNKKAKMNLRPLPKGDVISTSADISALYEWVKFRPSTNIESGLKKFINWFNQYYES